MEELLQVTSTPAQAGGLSGTDINIEQEKQKWIDAAPPHRKMVNRDLNIDWLVKREVNRTIKALKNTKKRKASPTWSCPTELLILALDPSYNSTAHISKTGLGAKRKENAHLECKECLQQVIKHMHYTCFRDKT